MGSAQTPPYSSTLGILVPWGWRDVTSDTGTYYGHADPIPGHDEYTGDTRTRVDLQGIPSYVDSAGAVQVPGSVVLQATKGGAGGEWVWRRDGGVWYGQERPVVVTGYSRVENVSGGVGYAPSVITLRSGHLLAAWGGTEVSVRRREVGTEWTETTVQVSTAPVTAPPDGNPCALVQMPDGGILLMCLTGYLASTWGLAVYRSADDGDTWTLQVDEAVTWATDAPRVMRAAVLDDGRIVLFTTRENSTSSASSHYISADGGTTWTAVEEDIDLNAGGTDNDGLVVWDARSIRGALVLVVEWGAGASGADNGLGYIVAGDPAAAVLSTITTTTATLVTSYAANEKWVAGGCIAEDPASPSGYLVLAPGDPPLLLLTASATSVAPANGGSAQMAQPQMTWWRGALCVVCARRASATIIGDVYEVRLGGQSDVTWTRDYNVGAGSPVQWIGLGSVADSDFNDDDSGAGVTRTTDAATGQRIVTDGVSQGGYSPTIAFARGRVAMGYRVRVASGTVRMTLQASDGTDQFGIYIEVTSTQIRAYDLTGAASSYVNHGATSADYLDVYGVVDARSGAASGRCYWRAVDGLYPHTTTDDIAVAGLAATAGTTTITRTRALASSDVYWLWIWSASKSAINRMAIPTITDPGELVGIPLSGYEARHIADGMTGRIRGLPVAVDEVTHPVYITGEAPFAHIWPDVCPSPRKGWTMPSNRDNTIRLQPCPGSAAADTGLSTQWIGIYLAGLVGVHHVTIAGLTHTATTVVDLRYPLAYTPDGWSVTGVASGTNVPGRWIGQNELKDAYFACESGVRKIIGNSAGTLSSGATVGEVRAVLWLDGSPGVAATGYIWPKDACIIIADSVRSLGELTLTIESSDADTGTGTRTIGTLAAGPIYLMGMAPDRTITRETQIGAEVVDLPDGSDYLVDRAPNRRRIEFGYVESPHDLTGYWPPDSITSGSRDYVATPTDSGRPDIEREPAEVLSTLIAAVGRSPIVGLFGIQWQQTEGQIDVQTPVPWRQRTIYGRFAGDPRIQQVQTMTEGAEMSRLELMAIEEIR